MQYFGVIVSEEKEVTIMQMYEVTAMAPEGPEEVYQAVIFAEDEDVFFGEIRLHLRIYKASGERAASGTVRTGTEVPIFNII